MEKIIVLSVLILCRAVAFAAPSFQADKALPDLGLCVRILSASRPEPLPQPKVHSYTVTRGEEKSQHDLFSAYELWYASQHAGQWRDAAGNVMIIAQPTLLLPAVKDALSADHVTREAYKAAAGGPEAALNASSDEALAAWVASFTGVKPSGVEKLKVTAALASAVFFPAADAEAKTLTWGFRVKMRGLGGPPKPSGWYVVVLRVNDGSPLTKVRQDFEATVLGHVAAVSMPGPSKGPPKGPGPASSGGPAIPGMQEAKDGIRNMEGWWFAEDAEYLYLTNIRSAAGQSLVRELRNTLPVLQQAYAKVVEPFSDKKEANVIRIFESKEAYTGYVGEGLEWSIGCWMPSRRELCILSQGTDNKADKEQTAMIIRHEAFHQFLFYASGGIEDAVWFNEGHACFFEAAEVSAQKRVVVGESQKKRSLMDNLDAAAQNIPVILDADHAKFYSGDAKQRQLNYATAWGLVYFLRCGTSSGKAAAYAGILGNYRKALQESKSAQAATKRAFEDVDMKAFQTAFLDFWRKGSTKRFKI